MPNGNPLDELLHIQKGRHYGFPARHPKHLPDVIDEPSTFDYGPQHQSTCGFCFNEPVTKDGEYVRPEGVGRRRVHDGRVARQAVPHAVGEDGDRLRREEPPVRVAQHAHHRLLPRPDGSLVVACHSGGPDWGSGPTGKGKLYKISYTDKEHPQPVLVYPAGPREVRVEFDRPVDPQLLRDVLSQTKITAGKFVRAGDRFEQFWPGYAVVQAEKATPRFNVPIHSAQLTPDRRTLVLATDPFSGRGALRAHATGHGPTREGGEGGAAAACADRSRLRPERRGSDMEAAGR